MRKNPDNTNQEAQDGYRHVLKYTGIFGGVQGLKILMNIVRTKLTSVFLGSYGMGLNAIFQRCAELVNSGANFGLSFSSLQRLSEIYDEGSEQEKEHLVLLIRTWCFWTAILGGLLCLLVAPLFSYFYFPTGATHIKELLLLSLFVAAMPIEAGECAILKGLRQLKSVAKVEMLCAVFTFLLTVPIYYWLGVYGVVLSLVLVGWSAAIVHLCFSCRLYRYRVRLFSKEFLKSGLNLVKIGVPFAIAAIVTAATNGMVLRVISEPHQIGFFQAGFNLMVTYGGMVFVAVEADYFPRLSASNHDLERRNYIINQQIDVCVSLMTPLLIMLVFLMPIVLRVLYAPEFCTIAPMAILAVYYMFFKAITMPIAYTPLAKGDSLIYLAAEVIYDVVYLGIMYVGYHLGCSLDYTYEGVQCGGLVGAGVALSLASLFDLLFITTTYSIHYHFRFRLRTLVFALLEMLCLLVVIPFCFCQELMAVKYVVGTLSLVVSLFLAWHFMAGEKNPLTLLKNRMRR